MKTTISPFLFALALLISIGLCGNAKSQAANPLADVLQNRQSQFLPVDQAFQFDFSQRGNQLTLSWNIAEGYYLYKKQFKTVNKGAELGEPLFPQAQQIEDEFFGTSDVFFNRVSINYPIQQAKKDGVVKIRYQGCAEAGLCYPPTVKVVYLSEVVATDDTADADQPQQFDLAQLLSSEQSLLMTLLLFLALGIGLAFTPCVFPMYPILSSIVLGQGKHLSMKKALALAFTYVQGMAITYSALGLVVASVGVKFQAALQHPVILLVMIGLFVVLALSMFGLYELQLPFNWQNRLNQLSQQQKGGHYAGVFLMGVISALVASPCTTAPLTGILLYVAQSGDLLLGFSALYALSLGMGIPLILFAVTGGKLLPKAGIWMNVVKAIFGFMMLAVALVFVERMVTNLYTELAWAALGLALFAYLFFVNFRQSEGTKKYLGSLFLLSGLLFSAWYGYHQIQAYQRGIQVHPEFVVVKDLADLQSKLAQANGQNKSVMVDLYADWCVACKEFEKYTFPDEAVIETLSNTVWMQIDLTDNTPENMAFQEHFGVFGLPTILFFDRGGNEVPNSRVTGFMRAKPFAEHVQRVFSEE